MKAALSFAAAPADNKRATAMVPQAKSDPLIAIDPDELDSDPYLLNVQNGVINLKTDILRPHTRGDRITKLGPTPFDPNAACPRFEKFLRSILPHGDLIAFAQRFLRLCLTGNVRDHVLPILWGGAANGKSSLLAAVRETIGEDCSMAADPKLLLGESQGHSTERMDLAGQIFVVCSKTSQAKKLNEKWLKQLIGGDRIRGRRVFENTWEFSPQHKIVLVANLKPEVDGQDHRT